MKFATTLFTTLALISIGATGAAAQTDHAAHPDPVVAAAAPTSAEGIGFVRAINVKAASVTIAHEPIPALNWPAMTMPFKVADPALLKDVKVGAKVRFKLQGQTIIGLTVL